MRAVLSVASKARKIDAGISLCGHGAGGNLPFHRVGFIVREAIIFQANGAVAIVIELYPAIPVRVVGRHYLIDGQRAKILRGKDGFQGSIQIARIRNAGCRHAGEPIGTVGCARIRDVGIQRRNFHLRDEAEVGVRHKQIVPALAQAEVRYERVVRAFGLVGCIECQIFACANDGAFGHDELV